MSVRLRRKTNPLRTPKRSTFPWPYRILPPPSPYAENAHSRALMGQVILRSAVVIPVANIVRKETRSLYSGALAGPDRLMTL